jgi:zinc protease
MSRVLISAIVAILPIFPVFADNPPPADSNSLPPIQKVTTVEGITEYRLNNGMRVLLFPDPSKPVVTINMTVLVGSRHEGYGETGMAHLLEHMLFKGTPTFPQVPKSLRDHGAARFNGSTFYDRTNYWEVMPSTDENLEFGVQLEADRLVHSYVKREDLISEMTVVRNEFEMNENNPETILFQRAMSAAFEWHNYGKLTIGNRSDIERVPITNLQAFYRKYYQPDNVMFVVAGKFDQSKALEYIRKYFGPLKAPNRFLDQTYTEEPPQDGERVVTLRRVGTVGAAIAVYHVPSGAHPDYPAVEMLGEVLGNEPSGRLYKALVETKLASRTQAGSFALHDPGVLLALATGEPKNLDAIRDKLIATMEGVRENKVTPEEVDRVKTEWQKRREALMSDSSQLAINLSEWAATGDWRLFFLHRDRINKVTADDVNRVAAAYLLSSNRTVGVFIPTQKPVRAAVPETPVIADMLKNYTGGTAVAAGEAFDPTPANLDARVRESAIGNIKVGLLPKKTRGEMATVVLTLRFGNEESLKNRKTTIDLLGDMLERGTKKHSRKELKDALDKLHARLSFRSDVGMLMITLQAKRDKMDASLELLTEMLREPSFPESEFETLKAEVRDQLDRGRTDPIAIAQSRLLHRLNPYPKDHPLYNPTIEEEIDLVKAAKIDDLKSLYNEQISAQAGEVAVLGDFDADSTVKRLQTMLSNWTCGVPHRRIPRPAHPEVAGSRETINTPDKANAVYVAAMTFPVGESDPDSVALEVGDYMFGGGPLTSRLANRIRQKDGLSYGVGSHYNASPRDQSSQFLIFAIANPKNVEKVDAAVADEMQKYLEHGPSLSEMNDALKGFLDAKKVARTNDLGLATDMINNLNLGRKFAFEDEREKKAAALSPDEIKDAFRRHIDPKKLVIIRAGDFNKK